MLIGAHVSTAGGLANAIERGEERGCESIQIFHQSPRMWRPTNYGEEDFAAFREAMTASSVEAVVIHAVYLINCASKDKELRKKSLASLTHALRIGDGIGAAGVVLHPGAQKGEPLGPSMKRAAKTIAAALEDSDSCPLLLEQTAGHKGLLGRDFDQTAELIELAGGGKRLGLCLDSCHLFVQGYDITDEEHLGGRPRRSRRQGRPRAPRLPSTSTTPPPRSAPAATATPTSARARWAAGPRRLPLRAPLRGPAGDPGDAGAEEEGLRQEGSDGGQAPAPRRAEAPRGPLPRQATRTGASGRSLLSRR